MLTTGKPDHASDDRALLAAIASGDQGAMERLYDRYSPMVLALALRILRDRPRAEELLNDVFLELWTRVARFDATRGSLSTYLLTLCRSRAIDRLRAQRRHAAVPLDVQSAGAPLAGDVAPMQRLIADEHRERLCAALAGLGPELRQALELAYFEDLSHSQIAERLGRPLGTVKTHIRQGLIQLRDHLRILISPADDAAHPGSAP